MESIYDINRLKKGLQKSQIKDYIEGKIRADEITSSKRDHKSLNKSENVNLNFMSESLKKNSLEINDYNTKNIRLNFINKMRDNDTLPKENISLEKELLNFVNKESMKTIKIKEEEEIDTISNISKDNNINESIEERNYK